MDNGSNTDQQAHSIMPGRMPLYSQVKSAIVSNVISGKWKPGQILPSEIALASEFGVSQGTIRKALNDLENQNLLVRIQGRGTFVSEHTPQRSLFHFFHIISDDGMRELPTSIVLSQRRVGASKQIANNLSIEPHEQVHEIVRLRRLRGRPVLFEKLWLPIRLFPTLEFPVGEDMNQEFYVLYQQRYHVIVHWTQEKVRAIGADKSDGKFLEVAVGTPLLEIERIAYDLQSRPVELRVDHCSTNGFHYLQTEHFPMTDGLGRGSEFHR